MSELSDLVELGDLDELIRHVDRLVDRRDWDGLVELRDRCRAAVERGRQLWPAASRAEYRLALDAPGRWAASVLVEGAGRFALGPLPEVAASTHRWHDLAPHLTVGPGAAFAAHERVARGDDLTGDRRVPAGGVELPLALAAWEPAYPLATYKADDVHVDDPPQPLRFEACDLPPPAPAARLASAATVALTDLTETWVRESNGTARAVEVAGDAPGAVAALHRGGDALVAAVTAADAMATMAWAAASGGAHGHRQGMAAGRFAAWWAAASLAGIDDPWPPDADALGDAVAALRWYRWAPTGHTSGWSLRLAVEDTRRAVAWAVEATDCA